MKMVIEEDDQYHNREYLFLLVLLDLKFWRAARAFNSHVYNLHVFQNHSQIWLNLYISQNISHCQNLSMKTLLDIM